MSDSHPSPDYLRQRLRYEADTGRFFWREASCMPACWNGRYAGKEALTFIDKDGYLRGSVCGRGVAAHRVAWAIHYGEWPKHTIDHINQDPSDNRIENLRDVSVKENSRNQRLRKNNTSGAVGVYFDKRRGKWQARIQAGKKYRSLGMYIDKSDAISAYRVAAREIGMHPNHGKHAS